MVVGSMSESRQNCVCGQSILKVSRLSDPELGSSAPTVLISSTALHALELDGNGAQREEGQLCLVFTAGHSSPARRSILLFAFHLTSPAEELLYLERTQYRLECTGHAIFHSLAVCLLPAGPHLAQWEWWLQCFCERNSKAKQKTISKVELRTRQKSWSKPQK
ncbi:hypothetical protein AOLI_G00162610 [Acnodon oligacanthus]